MLPILSDRTLKGCILKSLLLAKLIIFIFHSEHSYETLGVVSGMWQESIEFGAAAFICATSPAVLLAAAFAPSVLLSTQLKRQTTS